MSLSCFRATLIIKGAINCAGNKPQPAYLHAQRWGSAFKAELLPDGCLSDPSQQLAACGDFCKESSSEGAIKSGLTAADAVIAWKLAA